MKRLRCGLIALMMSVAVYGAGVAVNAVEASVKRVDAAGKTITVKTADGTEHTFRVIRRTTVHGVEGAPEAGEDSLKGLREGSDVVVHYTKHGSEETAEEIDRIGEGGLKETKGTLMKLDRGGKKVIVKSDEGVEETYDLSDHAAQDAGKDVAEGSERTAKVTVYYAEKGGRKIAHFFKAAV